MSFNDKMTAVKDALFGGEKRLHKENDTTKAQGVFAGVAVIGMLVTLLVAAIILFLGPTILALLEDSLPSANNSSFNNSASDFIGNINTVWTVLGVLLILIVIGAMITVLIASFASVSGGGRGGLR